MCFFVDALIRMKSFLAADYLVMMIYRFVEIFWFVNVCANLKKRSKPSKQKLVGGFKYFFIFTPTWGNDPI